MAQLNDLVVTGQTRCIGPVLSEKIKIGNAVIKYDESEDTLRITFNDEE
jgi:hypothetical protein